MTPAYNVDATAAQRAGEVSVEILGLSKTFPGTRALRGVDLQIRAGEVHALVGQNGSGKSTLIKVLAGFHAPDDGVVASVAGAPFKMGDQAAARSAGLRFVHQDLGLVSEMSAVDNLALGSGYAKAWGGRIHWAAQRRAARDTIGALGHSFDVDMPVSDLAAVERTALAISRALRGSEDLSLLVLDEPTATMPAPDVARLHALVRRVSAAGVSVLYVSHHLGEVFELADRVTVLRDGESVGTHDVSSLTKRQLVEMMTGSVIDEPDSSVQRAPTDAPVFEVVGLSGDVLDGFDLVAHRGEIVGIAGLAGSGRDELCQLLFGGKQRRGAVRLEQILLPSGRPDAAVDSGLALVPADRHHHGLVMSMSVRENITLSDLGIFWKRLRLRHSAERSATRRWIDVLGVRAPGTETAVENLSGGNQQKVVIGKWLMTKPKVLLLDEPTQGVDIAAKAEIHLLVENAAAEGAAVIVCSSDEEELQRLCDRVLVLQAGHVVSTVSRPHISAARLAHDSVSTGDSNSSTQGAVG